VRWRHSERLRARVERARLTLRGPLIRAEVRARARRDRPV